MKTNNFTLVFFKYIKTKNGYVFGIRVVTDNIEVTVSVLKNRPVNINCFPEMLGHPIETKVRILENY